MELKLSIKVNDKLYLRDPESTLLGKNIIKHAVVLIYELGFEHFTFKKLSEATQTTEATIYRYFENKHRLLLYLVTWYWTFLEYQVVIELNNVKGAKDKIRRVLHLLSNDLSNTATDLAFDKKALYGIVISESSKAYFSKEVDAHNRLHLFKPYKDLCTRIAALFKEYNPQYPYPRSLASTVIEAAHYEHFFAEHLPSLTDMGEKKDAELVEHFLEHLVFSVLKK